ncbi:hypothetical protein E2562_036693 [Oryza meyeriana var. granulata]|uniref:DUF834 domain-containing protein n=1 Tax=Oryza meyeriana var. granulata TaxID=110450 RepID=A0A6G1DSP2_9ORYZ|nr:hypothetical protein E2562_036693 [Oryza meyeriana var. granulata]
MAAVDCGTPVVVGWAYGGVEEEAAEEEGADGEWRVEMEMGRGRGAWAGGAAGQAAARGAVVRAGACLRGVGAQRHGDAGGGG